MVRLTGDGLDEVLGRVLRGALVPGRARRVALLDRGEVFDDGVAVLRRGPRSYTGEDLVEVSLHGNPLLVERFVRACLDAGARLAGPGELTRRAVVNGRLGLVAAEAVDQLIRARSAAGVAVARAGVDGRLDAALEPLRDALLAAAAELEARLDWPGDDLALEDDGAVAGRLRGVADAADALAATHLAGRLAVDGARVALVGSVNAGKSSLFNALLGRPRALVHPTPGTTRDVLELPADLDGWPVTLLDTAGERATDDPVEAMGQALARELVDGADLLVVVLAAGVADPLADALLARTADRPRVVVWNGVDRHPGPGPDGAIRTSAVTGVGVAVLRTAIGAALGAGTPLADGRVVASARQRDRLLAVARAARDAVEALAEAGPAAAAVAVQDGLAELGDLAGADVREAVLDAVFARFCIGK